MPIPDTYKGISSVFGGVLIHITLGTFYTLGNVNTYMTSYLRKHVEPNANYANSIWINASFMLGQGIFMIVGGMMERRFGPRLTCLVGSLVFSGFVALTYYTVQWGFLWVVLTYGLIASFGVGLAYVAPLAAGMRWFPQHKGLVNGITVGGFGLGAFIFNQVQTAYMNPQNATPQEDGYFTDESILSRVPSLFVLLGGIYTIMQLVGSVLIFQPPEYSNEKLYNEGKLLLIKSPTEETPSGYSSTDETNEEPNVSSSRRDIEPREALYTNEFIQMWLMFALSTQSVQFINTMYKAFGQEFIHDDHFLATVGSVASLFNAGGRIAWGFILDRVSFRVTFVTECVLLATLILTFMIPQYADSKFLYLLWVVAIFFGFSGFWVIFPTATANVFGKTNAGTIYGMLFMAPALVGLLGAILFSIIQSELGFYGSFVVVAMLLLISVILMKSFPKDAEQQRIQDVNRSN